jgi:hypothetical protein
MFVDNFEDVFDGLGLFKHTLTTYNDEVLKSFINMSSPKLVSTKLYYGMPSMVPSTHFFFNPTFVLYNDGVNTMAYVVGKVFHLGISIWFWS